MIEFIETESLDEALRRREADARRTNSLDDPADAPILEPRFRLVPFDKIEVSTERPYLIKGILPREALIVVWGPPKCSKTFWTFDGLMHIALGREYRKRRVTQGPVVYVVCEGERGIAARVEAYRQRHLAEDHDPIPFYLVRTRLDLIGEHQALVACIRAQLGDVRPVAIAIDTLNRSLAGSESSDEDMTAYVQATDAVREAFGCAVVLVHHCGVDGSRPRGHTSLTGACDAQLAVKRDRNGIVTVTVEYMKDGPEGDQIFSRLEPVKVGTDEDGDAITSCVIVPADEDATSTQRAKVSGQAKVALNLLERAIVDAGEIPPASNHIPRDIRAVPVSLWRSYCYDGQLSERDNSDTKRKAFNRNSRRLQELVIIGIWQDWVWIAGHRDIAGHSGTCPEPEVD